MSDSFVLAVTFDLSSPVPTLSSFPLVSDAADARLVICRVWVPLNAVPFAVTVAFVASDAVAFCRFQLD